MGFEVRIWLTKVWQVFSGGLPIVSQNVDCGGVFYALANLVAILFL
jgi:hypothetical protein